MADMAQVGQELIAAAEALQRATDAADGFDAESLDDEGRGYATNVTRYTAGAMIAVHEALASIAAASDDDVAGFSFAFSPTRFSVPQFDPGLVGWNIGCDGACDPAGSLTQLTKFGTTGR